MVELRKRPAPAAAAPAPPAKKKSSAGGKAQTTVEAAASTAKATVDKVADAISTSGPPKIGDKIDLGSFGGEIETNDGVKTTLAKLVEQSKSGVVLFTYPKASTPGCTTQACLFRDSYEPLTATGLSIFGLSTDSPKANTTFKTKHNMPYALLCDPSATLIKAIGLKKSPSGTQRGVFVVSKDGEVLAAEPGSPAGTVEVVKKIVAAKGGAEDSEGLQKAEERAFEAEGKEAEDAKVADTAAEVAETAAKVDA